MDSSLRDSAILMTAFTRLQEGDGCSIPAMNDSVKAHCVLVTEQGTQFFNTRSSGNPPLSFIIGANTVLAGVDLAIKAMSVGERALVRIPPELAYGDIGSKMDGVGPGEDIVADLELISIQKAVGNVANVSSTSSPTTTRRIRTPRRKSSPDPELDVSCISNSGHAYASPKNDSGNVKLQANSSMSANGGSSVGESPSPSDEPPSRTTTSTESVAATAPTTALSESPSPTTGAVRGTRIRGRPRGSRARGANTSRPTRPAAISSVARLVQSFGSSRNVYSNDEPATENIDDQGGTSSVRLATTKAADVMLVDTACQTDVPLEEIAGGKKRRRLEDDPSGNSDEDEEETGEGKVRLKNTKQDPDDSNTNKEEDQDDLMDNIDEREASKEITLTLHRATDRDGLPAQLVNCSIAGAEWSVCCNVVTDTSGQECLALNVHCEVPPLSSTWSATAEIVCETRSLKEPCKMEFQHDFTSEASLATHALLPYARLTNRQFGFMLGPEEKVFLKVQISLVKISSRWLQKMSFECASRIRCKRIHIKIQSRQFCVSENYLSMFSRYFNNKFERVPAGVSCFDVANVTPDEFEEFLNAIHPHHSPVTCENVESLARLGFFYNVDYLHDQCERFLIDKRSKNVDFLVKLDMACEFRMPRLERHCMRSLSKVVDIRTLKKDPHFSQLKSTTKAILLDRLMEIQGWPE